MEILLRDRTTNQPRSVHSGRGGKSIAHDGWEAKSPMTDASNSNFDFSRGSRLSIDTDLAKVEISQAPRRQR